MSYVAKIKSTIRSTQNTGKITKAMQLVATSKLGANQQRTLASKPYAQKIRDVIGHVANSSSEYHHPYLYMPEKIHRIGIIIISSDRGLCGGLNTNLFRKLLTHLKEWHKKGMHIDVCIFGNKGINFFKHIPFVNTVGHANHIGDNPAVSDIIGIVGVMLKAFDQGSLNQLYIASNEFKSMIIQKPTLLQLLPFVPAKDESSKHTWDYIYEPDSVDLLNLLFKRYIEAQVYQALIENITCEHAARMIAMQNATENTKQIIKELNLAYNKARQASITRELAEIVAGADALN